MSARGQVEEEAEGEELRKGHRVTSGSEPRGRRGVTALQDGRGREHRANGGRRDSWASSDVGAGDAEAGRRLREGRRERRGADARRRAIRRRGATARATAARRAAPEPARRRASMRLLLREAASSGGAGSSARARRPGARGALDVPNDRDEERASKAGAYGRGGTGETPCTCGARAAASKRLPVAGARASKPRCGAAVANASGSMRRRATVTGGAAPCATAVPGLANACARARPA